MPVAKHKNRSGIIQRAKRLRNTGSLVERILWHKLRGNQKQNDIKFRYQHPLSKYVVDFVCLSAKLVIEIDGPSHEATIDEDQKRQDYIERLGYKVLRISNQDVLNDVNAVVNTIINITSERLDHIYAHKKTPPRNCNAISTLPQGEGD